MARGAKNLERILPFYNHSSIAISNVLRIGIILLISQVFYSVNGESDFSENGDGKTSVFNLRTSDFNVNFNVFRSGKIPLKRMFGSSISMADREAVKNAINDQLLFGPHPNDFFNPRAGPAFRTGLDERFYKPTIPPECEDSLYCTSDPSYPEEEIKRIVQDAKNYGILTGIGIDGETIGTRMFNEDTTNLCATKETYLRPYSQRKSLNEPWHRVINVDTFRVGYRLEMCLQSDHSCSMSFSSVKFGQELLCQQEWSYREIAVLSPHNGTLFRETFPVPSGCCCRARKIHQTQARSYPISDNHFEDSVHRYHHRHHLEKRSLRHKRDEKSN